MRLIERRPHERRACLVGGDQFFDVSVFEVEREDVGKTRDNYLGHRHSSYRLLSDDIGRKIEVTDQGSHYTCWYFLRDQS